MTAGGSEKLLVMVVIILAVLAVSLVGHGVYVQQQAETHNLPNTEGG